MATTVTIRDETASGKTTGELTLDLLTERVTVRELIRSRVYQEVKDHNVQRARLFRGLVQPEGSEMTATGYQLREPRQLDWKKQFEAAIEAFERNGFLLLVDDRQLDDLDEEIVVTPRTAVSFVRLVPLVGG